jgi:hypothetical protein
LSTDETDIFALSNGGSLDWGQMEIGSNLNLDNPAEGGLASSTIGLNEDLFGAGGSGKAALDFFA